MIKSLAAVADRTNAPEAAGRGANSKGPTAPSRWPVYDESDIAAVLEVLRSGRGNQWTGDRVRAFEEAYRAHLGVPHAVAVFNGTVALELALLALGIGSGDEVIVSSRSFVASASCVSTIGATPVFADVDPESGNITADTIAPLITLRTKAIIPVHLGGWPCDMPVLMALARKHGLRVIEDCAQAHGAAIGGKRVGSFGDAAAFSFCQEKIISTGGEGGLTVFQDEAVYRRAWSYKDHGKDFDLMREAASPTYFRYVHTSIGTNWRMLEMQAAIGLSQLSKLDHWLAARAANAGIWRRALDRLKCVSIPMSPNGVRHAHYKLYGMVMPERMKGGATRDDMLTALAEAGIRAFTGSCPEIYRERAFSHLDTRPLPNAELLGKTCFMVEVHPTLDRDNLIDTAQRAAEVIARFEKP